MRFLKYSKLPEVFPNSSPRPPSLRAREGGVQILGFQEISDTRPAIADPVNIDP